MARDPSKGANPSMQAIDWLVDVVIFAGAFGFGLLQLTLSVNLLVPDDFTRRLLGIRMVSPTFWAILATFLTCLPLIVRRKLPKICFASSFAFWLVFEWIFSIPMLSLIGVLVSLFTLAFQTDRNHTILACIIAVIGVLFASFAGTHSTLTSLLMFQNTALIIAVGFAGYSLNTSSRLAESARAEAENEAKLRHIEALRAEEALLTQQAKASKRSEEERVRIAREVHDITAHSLSAVIVQSQMAERLVDSDPDEAKRALAAIRDVSKSSLEELREVIGVLRAEGEAETQPLFGIGDIQQLASYLKDADIACEIDEQVSAGVHVPVYVSSALFSIAREAVTNVVRHAHASSVKIRIVVRQGFAEVAIKDDGCGISCEGEEGHGIEGMRERAHALGGSFDIRSYHEGETCVIARIPLSFGDAS